MSDDEDSSSDDNDTSCSAVVAIASTAKDMLASFRQGHGHSNSGLPTVRHEMLRQLRPRVRQLDPSRDPSASQTWKGCVKRLSITSLRGRFKHGNHMGVDLDSCV